MNTKRHIAVGVVVTLLVAPLVRAQTVVNPFSGEWATTLFGGVTGTVEFSVVGDSAGAQALQAMGGHPCGAPTVYYHGDYTDTAPDTGTMTACIVTAGHLVGRYQNSNTSLAYPGGDLDVTLDAAQTSFSGFFTSDDPGIPGQFPYSGTFVAHFPGDGCCTGGPPLGGLSLDPPTTFCSGLAAANAVDAVPSLKCTAKTLVSQEEKAETRKNLRYTVATAAYMVLVALSYGGAKALDTLQIGAALIAEDLQIINDPPDPSFAVPALPRAMPRAATGAGRCPTRLAAADCTALTAAISDYLNVLAVTASVAADISISANRLAGAVQADDARSAFLQQAFGTVDAGALAIDLNAQQVSGRALADLLRADHLDARLRARRAKDILSHRARRAISNDVLDGLVADGVASSRKAARKLLVGQLTAVSGTIDVDALAPPLDGSPFASQYASITLSEVAGVVTGLAGENRISSGDAQRLTADLAAAQGACGDATQRTAAIAQFVADVVVTQASASDAAFLRLAAQPLTALDLPESSCE